MLNEKNNIKNFCVTGGAGFIGSHFVRWLDHLKKTDPLIGELVVYDKLTYAADLSRLKHVDYTLIEGDICSKGDFSKMLMDYSITHIIHFAAESHVDRSIHDELPFIITNILGTATIMDAASQFWLHTIDGYNGKLFVHISTDEVYGAVLESEPAATEETLLRPSNPYAATKAASDQLVIGKMNGDSFPALIVRSSNNFGMGQNTEKFIPKVLDCLIKGHPIPIYGKGLQKRCWLSAQTYSEILWDLIEANVTDAIINVRGNETFTNLELVELMCQKYAQVQGCELSEVSQINYVKDRKNHDFFYHIDDSKLRGLKLPIQKYETLEAFLDKFLESF